MSFPPRMLQAMFASLPFDSHSLPHYKSLPGKMLLPETPSQPTVICFSRLIGLDHHAFIREGNHSRSA